MKKNIFNFLLGITALLMFISSCQKNSYTLGDLTAPTNLVITTQDVGQSTSNPNGDGSGDVKISVTADNALAYSVDFDANNAVDLVSIPSGSITHKYTTLGTNTYRITAVAFGKGGTSSSITKDVTVLSTFNPDPAIVTNLTGGSSKTWVVNKDVAGHFGVGPWDKTSITPAWWAAGINEKVSCCNCFYTATFTFTKVSATNYTLTVASPDGAFTKTGALAGGLPGIPASGGEACYSYSGGTSNFSFVPSSTGIASASVSGWSGTGSTQTSILLAGNNTYIGYGALLKEYEIFSITPTAMYLRVQGTETGNAWYLILKAVE
jgi:hypothetical protein